MLKMSAACILLPRFVHPEAFWVPFGKLIIPWHVSIISGIFPCLYITSELDTQGSTVTRCAWLYSEAPCEKLGTYTHQYMYIHVSGSAFCMVHISFLAHCYVVIQRYICARNCTCDTVPPCRAHVYYYTVPEGGDNSSWGNGQKISTNPSPCILYRSTHLSGFILLYSI